VKDTTCKVFPDICAVQFCGKLCEETRFFYLHVRNKSHVLQLSISLLNRKRFTDSPFLCVMD